MARVTVEDCMKFVDNRFHLVVLAANKANEIFFDHSVDKDGDKDPIVALRQIGRGEIDVSELENGVIQKYRRSVMTGADAKSGSGAAGSGGNGNSSSSDDGDGSGSKTVAASEKGSGVVAEQPQSDATKSTESFVTYENIDVIE